MMLNLMIKKMWKELIAEGRVRYCNIRSYRDCKLDVLKAFHINFQSYLGFLEVFNLKILAN